MAFGLSYVKKADIMRQIYLSCAERQSNSYSALHISPPATLPPPSVGKPPITVPRMATFTKLMRLLAARSSGVLLSSMGFWLPKPTANNLLQSAPSCTSLLQTATALFSDNI